MFICFRLCDNDFIDVLGKAVGGAEPVWFKIDRKDLKTIIVRAMVAYDILRQNRTPADAKRGDYDYGFHLTYFDNTLDILEVNKLSELLNDYPSFEGFIYNTCTGKMHYFQC